MKRFLVAVSVLTLLAACGGTGKESEGQDKKKVVATDGVADKVAEVTVVELKHSVFNHEIVSNGRVSARAKVDVNFRTPGVIAEIFVRNGQRVAKGQKIASLDTGKLENQLEQQREAVASASLEMQDVLIGQGYDPADMKNIPAEVMDLARLRSGLRRAELQLEATRRELAEAGLTAPMAGVVANLSIAPHNLSSSEPLCRIIDDHAMEVVFPVLESELPMVKPGDAVIVTPFSTATPHKGKIMEINPMVDENGMVRVCAAIDGGDGLIDGMNVRVNVKRAVDKALVIPKTALVLRQGRQVVFTLSGNEARWNYVTTGLENLDEYTVTEGLEPGMKVIVTGNENLAHEAPVKVVAGK